MSTLFEHNIDSEIRSTRLPSYLQANPNALANVKEPEETKKNIRALQRVYKIAPRYEQTSALLKGGVKIYEYKKTLLHQKIMIVDGLWVTVGSTNFDDRSFELNDEISVGIVDPAIAEQLKTAFNEDLNDCVERKFDEWKDRSLWHKFVDGLAYLANEQL